MTNTSTYQDRAAAPFTPGSWTVVQHSAYHSVADKDGHRVCSCFGEQAKANAHLIAAAPELFTALQIVRDYVVTMKRNGHEYQIAIDTALAKARGEA